MYAYKKIGINPELIISDLHMATIPYEVLEFLWGSEAEIIPTTLGEIGSVNGGVRTEVTILSKEALQAIYDMLTANNPV